MMRSVLALLTISLSICRFAEAKASTFQRKEKWDEISKFDDLIDETLGMCSCTHPFQKCFFHHTSIPIHFQSETLIWTEKGSGGNELERAALSIKFVGASFVEEENVLESQKIGDVNIVPSAPILAYASKIGGRTKNDVVLSVQDVGLIGVNSLVRLTILNARTPKLNLYCIRFFHFRKSCICGAFPLFCMHNYVMSYPNNKFLS